LIALRLTPRLPFPRPDWSDYVFVAALAIGGIIAVLLVVFLFDWGLIVLSSLAGASLIGQALLMFAGIAGVIFLALVIVGVVIQGFTLQQERVTVVS
jgi:hypothetical protein